MGFANISWNSGTAYPTSCPSSKSISSIVVPQSDEPRNPSTCLGNQSVVDHSWRMLFMCKVIHIILYRIYALNELYIIMCGKWMPLIQCVRKSIENTISPGPHAKLHLGQLSLQWVNPAFFWIRFPTFWNLLIKFLQWTLLDKTKSSRLIVALKESTPSCGQKPR